MRMDVVDPAIDSLVAVTSRELVAVEMLNNRLPLGKTARLQTAVVVVQKVELSTLLVSAAED